MNVFISWSGDRSKVLANTLRKFISDINQTIEIWVSDHDISPGSRWNQEISQQLDETDFGIICLTPENVDARWLLFEAGALSKSVAKAQVVPYRLGISATDVPFPLAQFQSVDANREGTKSLVQSINRACAKPRDDESLNRLLEVLWPKCESEISKIPVSGGNENKQRDDRELLEEILKLTRELHDRSPTDAENSTLGLRYPQSKPNSIRKESVLALLKIRKLRESIGDLDREIQEYFIEKIKKADHLRKSEDFQMCRHLIDEISEELEGQLVFE